MMFQVLLTLHSLLRWLVLFSLAGSVWVAIRAYSRQSPFSAFHNALRHWTATIAHIQLLIGITLYTRSPQVKYYWSESGAGGAPMFFGLFHFTLMLASIVIITVGSALAKRQLSDKKKFEAMFTWYGLALLIILLAIPWPFSPLASRPYLRIG